MKPEHSFLAERPLARHAAELVDRRGAAPADPAQALARFVDRVARALPDALTGLGGEARAEVTASEPREGVMRELLSRGTGLSAHGLLAGPDSRLTMLVSTDAAGVFQLVDMAFGGEGKAPDPLPPGFPLSARLLASRLENALAALVAQAAALGEGVEPFFSPVRQGTDIAALRPFPADAALWQVGFEVAFADREPWSLRLTLAAAQIGHLCGGDDGSGPARGAAHDGEGTRREPGGVTFGAIPLSLRATLVDMRAPLSRIAALKTGDVLPVAVARQVPLAIGRAVVAHGTVGEIDDRVALQIIQAFATEEPKP